MTYPLAKPSLPSTDSKFKTLQLTDSEINQFIEKGFVVVRQIFPGDLKKDVLSSVWAELGKYPENLASSDPSFIILKKVLYSETIAQIFTRRYIEVLNELCGKERWEYDNGVGYFFINYPAFTKSSWFPVQDGWHIDSNTEVHSLNSIKLGLLTFHLFTDISPGGGGTAVRLGSHKYSARILAEAGPQGIQEMDFSRQAVNATKGLPFIEITGQCGDVMFMHPLMVHTRSLNISNQVRIVGHKFFHLIEPMNLNRQNGIKYSPVEMSIIKALSGTNKK